MNVLLVGEDAAGIQALRLLAQSGHRIVAIMASPSRRANGGGSLWNVANKLGYTTWPAKMVKDPNLADQIRSEHVDILLNIHSLFLINKEVLNAPRLGSFNLHPGPLPRYAGLNSVCWAIYRGETIHGVTLHKMVDEVDAGPIVYQVCVEIDQDDTGLSLASKCVKGGIPLVARLLETASRDPDVIPLAPQDLTKREYFSGGIPAGGKLSWSLPARQIVNFVRACDFYPFSSPWGQPRAKLGEREMAISKARHTGQPCCSTPGTVGALADSGMLVASADEWIVVERVLVEGRYVSARDLLRSGDRLEDGR